MQRSQQILNKAGWLAKGVWPGSVDWKVRVKADPIQCIHPELSRREGCGWDERKFDDAITSQISGTPSD